MEGHTALSVRDAVDPEIVVAWVKSTYTAEYCFLALAMLLFYDTVCTMDLEVKYFWAKSLNLTNIVFFVNRYLGLLGTFTILGYNTFNSSRPLCLFSTVTRDISNYFIILAIDYILMIRVLALYSRERRITMFLYILLAFNACVEVATTTSIAILQHTDFGELAPGIIVCGIETSPPTWIGLVSWLTPLVFGLVLMALALRKAAEYWRLSKNLRGFRLVRVLLIDQVLYFCLTIFCCFFNLLQYRYANNALATQVLAAIGSPTLLCILGSRMMFNLREAAAQGVNIGTTYFESRKGNGGGFGDEWENTLTEIGFAGGQGPSTTEGDVEDPATPTRMEKGKMKE